MKLLQRRDVLRLTVEDGLAAFRCHLSTEAEDSLPASGNVKPGLSRDRLIQQLGQTLVEVLCRHTAVDNAAHTQMHASQFASTRLDMQ